MRIKLPALRTSYSLKKNHFTFESLYLVIYFFYSFFSIFSRSLLNINAVTQGVKALTIVSLGMLFCALNHSNVKRLVSSVLILVLFTIVAFKNDSMAFLCSCLLIVCACLTDFKKICKVSLIASLGATVMIMCASLVGVIPNRMFDHDGGKGQSLGFYFYSTYPYILMFVMIMYMYLKKKLTWLEIAFFVSLNFGVYKLSSLRLAFYLSFLILALYIVLVKFEMIHLDTKIICFLACIAYPVVFSVMILAVNTQNFYLGFWAKVDELFNGRLKLSQKAFSKYPVTIFGQNIEMKGVQYKKISYKDYFFIDSGYVYAILGYGIIFTCLLLLLHSMLFYKACKNNDKKMFIWLCAVLIFNIVNNMFASFDFNPVLLLIFAKDAESRKTLLDILKEKILILQRQTG